MTWPFIGLFISGLLNERPLEGRPFGLLSFGALLPIRLFGSYFYGMPEMRYYNFIGLLIRKIRFRVTFPANACLGYEK